MDTIYKKLIYAIIVIGYIISFAFSFTKHAGSVTAGYSCLAAGLFILVISIMVGREKEKGQDGATGMLKGILFSLPVSEMIVLAICIWLLVINVKYSKQIKQEDVTGEYKVFNSITLILVLLQLIILYKNNENDPTARGLEGAWYLVALLASFQFISIFITQINLEYFITEG